MGFLKEAAEHDMEVNLKGFVLTWGTVLVIGFVLDHFFGWDIVLRIVQVALGRPS